MIQHEGARSEQETSRKENIILSGNTCNYSKNINLTNTYKSRFCLWLTRLKQIVILNNLEENRQNTIYSVLGFIFFSF